MTAPEITAALEALIASTPPPVTVWGVRYAQSMNWGPPAGHIDWLHSEPAARRWLADCEGDGCPAELISITGHVRVHPADDAATSGADR